MNASLRSRLIDGVVVLVIFLASSATGYALLSRSNVRTLTEWESAPAAMLACGQGFRRPVTEGTALAAFGQRQRLEVTCAEVIGDGVSGPPLDVAAGERYGLYGAALAFRVAGLSWRALDGYLAVLLGLSMTFAYGLFRAFAGRPASIAGVLALCFSGHLLGLMTFRDYGKEPCFYALWMATAWLVVATKDGVDRRTLLGAAGLGAVTGIGLGFRTDILIAVPASVAIIVLGLPGFRAPALMWKGATAAVYIAVFAIFGSPILFGMSAGGSNTAHVVVAGLMTPFNASLGVESAPYDIGAIYSDGYAYTLITAHATVVQGAEQPVSFATARYDRLGVGLLTDLVRRFPADVLTRAAGAVAQVLRYPFDARYRAIDLSSQPFMALSGARLVAERIGAVFNAIGSYGPWLTAAVLAGMLIRDRRLALTCAAVLVYFCACSTLQFSRRHTFHLDLLALIAVVVALDQVGRGLLRLVARTAPQSRVANPGGLPHSVRDGLLVVCVIVVAGVSLAMAARWWQQRHVAALLERTLAVRWVPLPATAEPLAGTEEPAYYGQLDLWRDGVLMRVMPPAGDPSIRDTSEGLETSYLLAEVGGPGCSQPVVHLATAYSGSEHNAHRDYTRTFDVPATGAVPTLVLVPAFYQRGTNWTRFDGFATPAAESSCLGVLKRALVTREVELPVLTAVLPPDWRTRPLYQRLADVKVAQ